MGIYKMKNISHIHLENRCELRDEYDEETFESIKKSMEIHGFLPEKPIEVNLSGVILDGKHRYLSAKALNIKEIPIVETDARSELAVIEKQLIGILLKKGYTPMEKAKGVQKYIKLYAKKNKRNLSTHAYSKDEIAEIVKKLGIPVTRYYQYMKVLGTPEVKEAIENGDISFRKGEELARVTDDNKRKELIEEVKKDPKKVEEIRELVNEVNEIEDTLEISLEEGVGIESKPEVPEAPIQHDEKPEPPKPPEKTEKELTPAQEKKAFDDFKKILKMKRLPKLDSLPELGKSSQYGNTLETIYRLVLILKNHGNKFEPHTKERFERRFTEITNEIVVIKNNLRG